MREREGERGGHGIFFFSAVPVRESGSTGELIRRARFGLGSRRHLWHGGLAGSGLVAGGWYKEEKYEKFILELLLLLFFFGYNAYEVLVKKKIRCLCLFK